MAADGWNTDAVASDNMTDIMTELSDDTTAHSVASLSRPFHWQSSLNGARLDDVAIPIPYPFDETPVADLAAQISVQNNIPLLARQELLDELSTFCRVETERWMEHRDDGFVSEQLSRSDSSNLPCAASCRTNGVGGGDVVSFVTAYRTLVEQGGAEVLTLLLDKEASLGQDVDELVRSRDFDVERLRREHESIVATAADRLEDEDDCQQNVSLTAARHFEKLHTVEANYASQLTALSDSQRKEYRNFVFDLYDKHCVIVDTESGTEREVGGKDGVLSVDITDESSSPTPSSVGADLGARLSLLTPDSGVEHREESFTIYLGAQMKSMHNLRLSVVDPIEALCRRNRGRRKTVSSQNRSLYDRSTRLQMALHLYGNHLGAVLLLVDSRPNYHLSFHTDFARACEQSTELHFDSLENQLESIEKQMSVANAWRDSSSNRRTGSDMPAEGPGGDAGGAQRAPAIGDVYVTRHSNLAHVHVALHMVAPWAQMHLDINSRHPCINGLRNVVRLCSQFGVTTISVPLLLVEHLSEELTVQWCLKRAELVFKCIKGFLIEVGALNTHRHYTVQFLLPPDISQEVYGQIHEMLPSIFHLVRAVNS